MTTLGILCIHITAGVSLVLLHFDMFQTSIILKSNVGICMQQMCILTTRVFQL